MGETMQSVSRSNSFTLGEVPLTGYEAWRIQNLFKLSILIHSWINILWESLDSLVISTARETLRISW
jgi:hypothetical protein